MTTAIYLYLLAKELLSPRKALLAAMIYSVLPLTVIFTRTFQPESIMIFYVVFGF